ncbi:unnamed protein product [Gordionus sp. m RMFG-2023]|uniref:uncharacterized protein LOC135928201 n=1 Tax=Gordionus sp. m RMFG-2023 TaxID=3053472 RepID=UPI0030E12DAF
MFRCKRNILIKKLLRSSLLLQNQEVIIEESLSNNPIAANKIVPVNSSSFQNSRVMFAKTNQLITFAPAYPGNDVAKFDPPRDFQSLPPPLIPSNLVSRRSRDAEQIKTVTENFLRTLSDLELEILWRAVETGGRTLEQKASFNIVTTDDDTASSKCRHLQQTPSSTTCITRPKKDNPNSTVNTTMDTCNSATCDDILSPAVFCCLHWRWPDLLPVDQINSLLRNTSDPPPNSKDYRKRIKPTPFCSSASYLYRNYNPIPGKDSNNSTGDLNYSESQPICINPYHWSRKCYIDYPPPPYPLYTLTDSSKSNNKALKFDNANNDLPQLTSHNESTETGGTLQGVGSVVPHPLRRKKENTSALHRLDKFADNISPPPWCSLARWEFKHFSGPQTLNSEPVVFLPSHIGSSQPADSLALAIEQRSRRTNVYLFNQSTHAIFADVSHTPGQPIRLPPGHCARIYDSRLCRVSDRTKFTTLDGGKEDIDNNNIACPKDMIDICKTTRENKRDEGVKVYSEDGSRYSDDGDDREGTREQEEMGNFGKVDAGDDEIDISAAGKIPNADAGNGYTIKGERVEVTEKLMLPQQETLRNEQFRPHAVLRVSPIKGWGPGYSRRFIESCPVWYEITLFL